MGKTKNSGTFSLELRSILLRRQRRGAAHDFNNLLTTIIGNAKLALNDISKDDSLREQID